MSSLKEGVRNVAASIREVTKLFLLSGFGDASGTGRSLNGEFWSDIVREGDKVWIFLLELNKGRILMTTQMRLLEEM